MADQIKLSAQDQAPRQDSGDGTLGIRSDLAYRKLMMVNVVFWGKPNAGDRNWVLIDTGLTTSCDTIRRCAEARFGKMARPSAILLTHGHFDHVGCVERLAEDWDVPVYAHRLEFPYLRGSSSYPPADPWVGGGLMALLPPLYPRGPIDLGARLRELPRDGTIPGMPHWQWLHTPGHAPGHVSFWRAGDRTMIAGDAFITTGQESAYEVAMQELELHGPPKYFTPDWNAAQKSVARLAALEPDLAITGHGVPAAGAGMRQALHKLAREFNEIAVPKDQKKV